MKISLYLGAFVTVALLGCGDNPVVDALPKPKPQPAPTAKATATAAPLASARPAVEYSENDFIESDRNRDPFRGYARIFVDQVQKTTVNQRAVLLNEFSIADLKLVGIVLGSDPRAMLLDPTGKGWVVKRGDFLGRPEVIRAGGSNGTEFQINWRVDRIRDGDLVLTREDPSNPGSQPATQVLPLHPESDSKSGR